MCKGSVWPNRKFGITTIDKRPKFPALPNQRDRPKSPDGIQLSCIAEPEKKPTPTIGLSLVAKSHRAKRGQNGISSKSRLTVANGAFLLQKKFSNRLLSFLTLTIPTTSTDDNRLITEKWPDLTRVFVQWLGRRLKACGLDADIVGCTEIQETRSLSNDGCLGLHLHLVFRGRQQYKPWALTPKEIREEWTKCLKNVLPNNGEGYYYDAVENIQPVKNDASRYLGKYLTKGVKTALHFKALYPSHSLPACWSVCTMPLRNAVKACKMAGSGTADKIKALIDCGKEEYFESLNFCTFTGIEGLDHVCGWYGTLSEKGAKIMGIDNHVKMRLSALRG